MGRRCGIGGKSKFERCSGRSGDASQVPVHSTVVALRSEFIVFHAVLREGQRVSPKSRWKDFTTFLDDLQRAPREKQVILLVGNGINFHLPEFPYPRKLASDLGLPEDNVAAWSESDRFFRVYESWRRVTSEYRPSEWYALIKYLCFDARRVHSVITTNYDLILDGLWERHHQIPVVRNPILEENEPDYDGYYSRKIDSSQRDVIRFFKIHGCLSFITYSECMKAPRPHRSRLPRFSQTMPVARPNVIDELQDYCSMGVRCCCSVS